MQKETLFWEIDATGAQKGSKVFRAAITAAGNAISRFDSKTANAFKTFSSKTATQFRGLARDIGRLSSIKVPRSLGNDIKNLAKAMLSFKGISPSKIKNLQSFSNAVKNLRVNNGAVSALRGLGSAFANMKPPTRSQTANLKAFVEALSQLKVPRNARAIAAALAQIATASSRAQSSLKGLRGGVSNLGFNKLSTGAARATQNIRGLENAFRGSFQAASLFRTAIGSLTIGTATKGIFDATTKLQKFDVALQSVLKSPGEVAEITSFVTEESDRLGVSLEGTIDRFAKLVAALTPAGVSLNQTKDIFTGLATAGSVFGASAEDMKLIFLAVEQIFSKGKVSTEELRRQLGERLPGAFQLFAESLVKQGVIKKTQDLDKALRDGKVGAETFIPFINDLGKKFAKALPAALKRADSQLNILNNSLFKLQTTIGLGGFGDALAGFFGNLAEKINSKEITDVAAQIGAAMGKTVKTIETAVLFLVDNIDLVIKATKIFVSLLAISVTKSVFAFALAPVIGLVSALPALIGFVSRAATGFGLFSGILTTSSKAAGLLVGGLRGLVTLSFASLATGLTGIGTAIIGISTGIPRALTAIKTLISLNFLALTSSLSGAATATSSIGVAAIQATKQLVIMGAASFAGLLGRIRGITVALAIMGGGSVTKGAFVGLALGAKKAGVGLLGFTKNLLSLKGIMSIIKGSFSGILSVVGGVGQAFLKAGNLVKTVGIALTSLGGGLSLAAVATTALTAGFAALVGGAVVATIVGIVNAVKDLVNWFQTLKAEGFSTGEILGAMWETTKQLGAGTLQFLKDEWNKFTTVMSNISKFISDKFKTAWEDIQNTFKPFVSWFSGLFDDVKTAVGPPIQFIIDLILEIPRAISGAIRAVFDGTAQIIDNIANLKLNPFSGVVDAAVEGFDKGAQASDRFFTAAGNGISNLATSTKNGFTNLGSSIKDSIVAPFTAVSKGFANLKTQLADQTKANLLASRARKAAIVEEALLANREGDAVDARALRGELARAAAKDKAALEAIKAADALKAANAAAAGSSTGGGTASQAKDMREAALAASDFARALQVLQTQQAANKITQEEGLALRQKLNNAIANSGNPLAVQNAKLAEERILLSLSNGERKVETALRKVRQNLLEKGVDIMDKSNAQMREGIENQIRFNEKLANPDSFNKFNEGLKSMGEGIAQLGQKIADDIGGSIADFVVDGKSDFKSMIKSWTKDLIKLSFKNLLGGGGSAGGGLFSGLFGGGGGGGGGFFSSIFGGLFKDGGISNSPTQTMEVRASTFRNAPQFGDGGVTGSGIPAILHPNEAVIPLKGGKVPVDMGSQGSGRNTTNNISFNITTPDAKSFEKKESHLLRQVQRAILKTAQRDNL